MDLWIYYHDIWLYIYKYTMDIKFNGSTMGTDFFAGHSWMYIYIYVTGNLWIRVPDPGPDLCHCGGKEAPKSVADR